MTKKEFKKKLSEFIQRDFKGLRKPCILFVNREDMFMATLNLPFFYLLFVDKEVFDMNDKAIVGCFVHELCYLAVA
jgi:hypothetical protein